jgi:hypothetical protein
VERSWMTSASSEVRCVFVRVMGCHCLGSCVAWRACWLPVASYGAR